MESKNKKKTINLIGGLLAGLTIAILINQIIFKAPSFDKQMMAAASKINESCPIIVDQDTRLDNTIVLPKNIFQYNYTLVNLIKDSIDINGLKDYLQLNILNNIKTNPDLKTYRDNKVTMAYFYKDKNGEFVLKIAITADEYTEE